MVFLGNKTGPRITSWLATNFHFERPFPWFQTSNVQNLYDIPLYTDWLIGILIMAQYSPYITWYYNPLCTADNQGFGHCSKKLWTHRIPPPSGKCALGASAACLVVWRTTCHITRDRSLLAQRFPDFSWRNIPLSKETPTLAGKQTPAWLAGSLLFS